MYMAINKAMRAVLKAITALEPDVKKTYKVERHIEALTARLRGKPTDYIMWDQTVVCGNHQVPVRMFLPEGDGPFRTMLYFHGGGWVTGGIDNYTGVCADLSKATGCMVASVDYRLAPEHKFPAAPEDCYAVAKAFYTGNVGGINTENIVLAGDSAGGNLAAAVSLMARDRGEFMPQKQILFYPATYSDHTENSPYPSIKENGYDYILTSKRVQDFIDLYMSSDDDLSNPYFAPLLAKDFSNQPDTLVVTAEFCPLRDEGEAYGEKLSQAGSDVTIVRVMDALHAFLMLPPQFDHVQQAYAAVNSFLAKE